MKYLVKTIIVAVTISLLLVVAIIYWVRVEYKDKIYSQIGEVPENSVVVVLGASVKRDKTPNDALEDRLNVAADIWRAGKTQRIILSGDDGRWAQPEIPAMLNYMYNQGVPQEVLIADGDNARTYDSCYRLKHELKQDDVVLVTQGFHLPRALYLCNEVGLDAWGIDSDLRPYSKIVWFTVRDWLASFLAYWDILLSAKPSYLTR